MWELQQDNILPSVLRPNGDDDAAARTSPMIFRVGIPQHLTFRVFALGLSHLCFYLSLYPTALRGHGPRLTHAGVYDFCTQTAA